MELAPTEEDGKAASYGDYSKYQWKQILSWKKLPEGIFFNSSGITGNNFLVTGDTGQNLPKPLPTNLTYHGEPVSDVVAQTYQPDGVLTVGELVRLRLVEGVMDSGSTSIAIKRKDSSGNPVNYYDIVVLRDTGEPKVERL
jgi:hypothetical protein